MYIENPDETEMVTASRLYKHYSGLKSEDSDVGISDEQLDILSQLVGDDDGALHQDDPDHPIHAMPASNDGCPEHQSDAVSADHSSTPHDDSSAPPSPPVDDQRRGDAVSSDDSKVPNARAHGDDGDNEGIHADGTSAARQNEADDDESDSDTRVPENTLGKLAEEGDVKAIVRELFLLVRASVRYLRPHSFCHVVQRLQGEAILVPDTDSSDPSWVAVQVVNVGRRSTTKHLAVCVEDAKCVTTALHASRWFASHTSASRGLIVAYGASSQ